MGMSSKILSYIIRYINPRHDFVTPPALSKPKIPKMVVTMGWMVSQKSDRGIVFVDRIVDMRDTVIS